MRVFNMLKNEPIYLKVCSDSFSMSHKHSFFEFVYVLKGRAEHTINDSTMILSEGDYFLIDLDCMHEYRKLDSEPELCIVNCMFKPCFIDEALRGSKNFYSIVEYCLPGTYNSTMMHTVTLSSYHDNTGYVEALIKQMLREQSEKGTGYETVLRGSLINLLIAFARNDAARSCTSTDSITRYVTEYVAKNYACQIQLSEICEQMNFSLTYVSSVFKRDMGMSFREYLIKVRIEKACCLLQTDDMTIDEIADAVGYSDPSFFFKCFKRSMGLTPYKYKKLRSSN